jgi:multicomponent Na+:H+ antiporter subunit E
MRRLMVHLGAFGSRQLYAPADMRDLLLLLMLAGAWLLWSGGYSWPGAEHYHGITASLGVGSVLVVHLLIRRLLRVAGAGHAFPFGIGHLRYLPWLLVEIVKANFDVARIVLSKEMAISPRLIKVKANQKSVLGQVVYANSITLTPGTISLDLRDGEIMVHALTNESAEGVLTGEMDARVCRMEKRG